MRVWGRDAAAVMAGKAALGCCAHDHVAASCSDLRLGQWLVGAGGHHPRLCPRVSELFNTALRPLLRPARRWEPPQADRDAALSREAESKGTRHKARHHRGGQRRAWRHVGGQALIRALDVRRHDCDETTV